MTGTAVISDDKKYRYSLTRTWDETLPRCVWVMLNPSTANATQEDATIFKCIRFSTKFGYGGLEVVNLFAYRNRSVGGLLRIIKEDGISAAIGLDTNEFTQRAVSRVGPKAVIAAWGACGNMPSITPRETTVKRMLPRGTQCLCVTSAGCPGHPLYLPKDTLLTDYFL